MNNKYLGNLGEKIAENFLINKGYEILDRNYSPKFISGPKRGEIDIIAKINGTISFIEVKTLLLQKNFLPEDKVDFQKQRKIIKTAQSWLMERKISFESPWQVDIIAVNLDPDTKKAKIRFLKNVVG
jgi:putative endonuclease